MNLNLATAAFFTALVELALGIGMLALWAREKKKYLIYWGSGFLAFGFGSLLISLRGKIPDFLTILTGNLSTTLSSVLFYIGICLFFNRRRSMLPWLALILALEAAFLAYYTYITYDTSARVYVYSVAQTLATAITLRTLFAVKREQGGSINPEVVIVTSLFLATHTARILGTSYFPAPQDFLTSGNFQTLLSFGVMLIHINYALAFGNMHASALQADLNAALSDVKTKDRQKVEVLGYISHDLRAPLATISGYSALLLGEANDDQRKQLHAIQRGVKYQLNLIDELLEYAQAELQPLAVQPGTTDLPLLLDEISEYAVALCSQRNNRFRYRAPERMPRQMNLDRKRLQQVLLNLLTNAAKFTQDGVVALTVTAKPAGGACTLHFSVSDTGIGIDLKRKTDIFSAFQNIQATSGGTGLGLFIAQRIVSAMGGSLSVDSASGQGTTFSFVLVVPIVDAPESDWSGPAQREIEPARPSTEPTTPAVTTLDDEVLDELATLALHGRLTDIERWIEHHANHGDHAPFAAQLRELLDRFDFPGLQALALLARRHSKTSMDACVPSR
ncbi:sensor histidine kinase [Ottowia thiooxydans]|uniref:sensor histidine kinase n=1 Tax=Ottowia thiooxydans TaxID=219182 RepID=UPI000414F3D4|nr:HAMP domain-containing sensor histidine kinase [Ottowia thiooxydans]